MGGVMVVPQSDSDTQFLLQFMPGAAGVEGSLIWIDCNDMQIEGKSDFWLLTGRSCKVKENLQAM